MSKELLEGCEGCENRVGSPTVLEYSTTFWLTRATMLVVSGYQTLHRTPWNPKLLPTAACFTAPPNYDTWTMLAPHRGTWQAGQ